jgi:FO synthase
MNNAQAILKRARDGLRPPREEALALTGFDDLGVLMEVAEDLTLRGFGRNVSYSRKVFVPLTQLCRDVCHYCTFAQPPRNLAKAFLRPAEVLAIARAGAAAGCKEVLFTLGDKPEQRYGAAREALARLGHKTTLSYLGAVAKRVLEETGLLPHLNPGLMSEDEMAVLRRDSVSMGIMLESSSERLCGPGGPHWGSPDKRPAARLDTLRAAGRLKIPFTSGILIGIGETRAERIESLLALRDVHDEYGHIQEIIVQNFRAKPGTRMVAAPEPSLEEQLWTIAVARILFGTDTTIQAPPNLRPEGAAALIRAGINDWGGVSPVTPDHVNPEAPWPHLDALAAETAAGGRVLIERLAVHPPYLRDEAGWLEPALRTRTLHWTDGEGYVREDGWFAGMRTPLPNGTATVPSAPVVHRPTLEIRRCLDRIEDGHAPSSDEIVTLFAARGDDFQAAVTAADRIRREAVGDTVRYVVNRNINYTNVCQYRCAFCAFSKGRTAASLRGPAYDLADEEIGRRVREAWERGATEVCLQGGIHPQYTGRTYLHVLEVVKAAAPDMHIHAFSPLEVTHGAQTLGLPLRDFLAELQAAGLDTLPGTAAEILDDDVRKIICPDKVSSQEWLDVMRTAHGLGLRTTATIMFGHVEGPAHWATHLLRVRSLQEETGGFTEFVPLPFVHMEAPIWLKGRARSGPTYREAILMHAVSRLVLHPLIGNIQASWVKMGPEGARECLRAGANDLGGVLMNESITRAAGADHGQEMSPARLDALIHSAGRVPRQRTTLYGPVPEARRAAAYNAAQAQPVVNTPVRRGKLAGAVS